MSAAYPDELNVMELYESITTTQYRKIKNETIGQTYSRE